MTVGAAVGEPLLARGLARGATLRARVAALLVEVGLRAEHAGRYPHQFSGGQRQRLCIARAVVSDPSIYLFDDSFSALDFATDAKLRAALKPVTTEATVLVVAQRVNTIMGADNILVLDEGRVVGQGRHHDLMESCETYREIVTSQLTESDQEHAA
jgi:ABC-type multidrug transport system fused ATPase/permease subunit